MINRYYHLKIIKNNSVANTLPLVLHSGRPLYLTFVNSIGYKIIAIRDSKILCADLNLKPCANSKALLSKLKSCQEN